MTVAPTLQKGLKRLFSSSLLRIIAIILAVIGLVTMIGGAAVALGNAITDGSSGGGLVAGGGAILTIISGILIIIAFFLSLVGVINVSKENNSFKIALYAVLAGIVLSIVSVFFTGNPTVSTILSLLVNISSIVMFLFTCGGIKELGNKLGRDDFPNRYNNIVIFYCLAAGLIFVGQLLGTQSIGYTINLVGQVCSIISYFMYLGYLRKGIHALEGVATA